MRKFGLASAAVSLALLMGGGALAAEDATPGAGRAAFREACGKDFQTLCPDANSRDKRRACIMANKEKFSEGCRSFIAERMALRKQNKTPAPAGAPAEPATP